MLSLRFCRSARCARQRVRTFAVSSSVRNASEKPFYITTPIFYPNAAPHIGHLYSLVAADALARYQTLRGRDVKFLAGTDEHGMKLQKAAQKHFGELGRELEFCDLLSQRFKDLAAKANISNTCFVRTTEDAHHRAVEDVWKRLYEKGYIYKSQYSGWYSVTDECFYTDAQVGPAPTASALDIASSSSPQQNSEQQYVSLETGAAVEWSSEENYMFRISAFRSALLSHILASPTSIYPPQYRAQVLGWLGVDATGTPLHSDDISSVDAELDDISISRPAARLSWGIPVPNDPSQTVYVWFDALLIYLSGAGYPWQTAGGVVDPDKMLAAGWPADVQVVGKDILRFHALYLPAILLALNAGPYTGGDVPVTPAAAQGIPLPRTLLAHAHWTANGRKMSKSVGNVVDPLEEMERWGVDGIRFYLMRVGGRWRGDVDWSTKQLEKHHKELAGQLGNYFLRIASPSIAARAVPVSENVYEALPVELQELFSQPQSGSAEIQAQLQSQTETDADISRDPNYEQLRLTLSLPARVAALMETCEAGAALGEIMEVLKHANKSVSDIEPWARTTPPALVHTTRIVGLETLRVVGMCLLPFIPEAAARLLETLDGGSGLVGAPEVLAQARLADGSPVVVTNGLENGKGDMENFWKRWNGRSVEGVRLF